VARRFHPLRRLRPRLVMMMMMAISLERTPLHTNNTHITPNTHTTPLQLLTPWVKTRDCLVRVAFGRTVAFLFSAPPPFRQLLSNFVQPY
jgi:hypothetical protein